MTSHLMMSMYELLFATGCRHKLLQSNHPVCSIRHNRRRPPCVSIRMRRIAILLVFGWLVSFAARASSRPVEVHQLLALPQPETKVAALTLDACGGGYDAKLIRFLVEERIPATVFATRKWIARNDEGMAMLRSHPELFDIEDHGANHVPAVIGLGRRVYGIAGNLDVAHLVSEVRGGAAAVETATGIAPHWYRGATAEYDPQALRVIVATGYKVAGFSINADAGATLKRDAIAARLNAVGPGDIILAHMNKPGSETAEGLASGLKSLLARGFHFVTLREMDVRPAFG
jgi:peptidoglycan/xylan/chitin deacetylase (PgdA/CDA1 family)